jgi:hypothetical protein
VFPLLDETPAIISSMEMRTQVKKPEAQRKQAAQKRAAEQEDKVEERAQARRVDALDAEADSRSPSGR